MDDDRLDRLLHALSAEDMTMNAGSDFQDRVWQRIGQIGEAREQKRRIFLGLIITVIGLGTGMGATQTPVYAEDASVYSLADGADLSPSALLHVVP